MNAKALKFHAPFLIVLTLHIVLSITYSVMNPLGEAPDEPAHYGYAQFIAKNGRLPATLEERQEAGYRAVWPPLYHSLVAIPIALISDTPPTRLKSVGDTPRRLIPTNGQTIASYIHTNDEGWPWQGITLAWHLGRLISVTLTSLTVIVTYLIAWRLTKKRWAATATAAIVAFLPQFLFTGSVITDDTLLILLSSLILLTLVAYTQRNTFPGFIRFLFLGSLLGLATVTKYNALPLWGIVLIWLVWQSSRLASNREQGSKGARSRIAKEKITETHHAPRNTQHVTYSSPLRLLASSILAVFLGAALTAGWWFVFIWRNFNQVDTLGPVAGSLAALSAGTADASLRQLSGAGSITLPTLASWPLWFGALFKSFWGLFGGGGTIAFANWIYWLLALICILTIATLIINRSQFTINNSKFAIFLIVSLFFLPLPLARFILTGGRIVETAQGRHLFPAIAAIALGLVIAFAVSQRLKYAIHFLVGLLFLLSIYSLFLIQRSFPPPIPLQTTQPATITHQLNTKLAPGVSFIAYQIGKPETNVLPVSLVWQATNTPPEDYLIDLTITDAAGNAVGGWLGHPIGGRYPTRAWDKGDILRDEILIPLLPNTPAGQFQLTLQLVNPLNQLAGDSVVLSEGVMLSQTANSTSPPPNQLRADGLSAEAPFSYRGTVTFVLPNTTTPPELVDPNGKTFSPNQFFSNSSSSIAQFIVGANWSSGNYQLSTSNAIPPVVIKNRVRQFTVPSMQHTLNANFANVITVLGYDLPRRKVEPGETFPVTLHLQANRTMGKNLAIFNHLLNQDAVQFGGVDRIPQSYYTTLLWVPGEIVSDGYNVPVDIDASPGVYWLDVGLYATDRPELSLPLVVDGQPIERNSVSIGPIKVGGPPPDVTVTEDASKNPIDIAFGNEITLLGYTLENKNPEPENLNPKLTLFWQADTIPQSDYTVFVHILDTQGNLVAQADSPPAAGNYPTSLWNPGEIIKDQRLLPALPPGKYMLAVGLYRPDTLERLSVENRPDGAVTLTSFEVPDD